MFRSRSAKQFLMQRRGSILLVVITFLALFAVVGLSFALFAESENTASRTHMEAFKINDLPGRANPEEPNAQEVANLVLGQIIYDTPDTGPSTLSAFRGHSLARLMYSGQGGLSPYNGQGLFVTNDEAMPVGNGSLAPIPYTYSANFGSRDVLRSGVFNYSYRPGSGVFFDPELSWAKQSPGGAVVAATPAQPQIFRGVNAGYTYPDNKDVMLAVFDTTTPNQIGRVLKPSFQVVGTNLSTNSFDMVMPEGRFKILRPRPIDQLDNAELNAVITTLNNPPYNLNLPMNNLSNFTPLQIAQINQVVAAKCQEVGAMPYPPFNADGTVTGDVQNFPYPNHQQHNDSFWMYPGGPIRKWNGKYYTAVVAPMVIDLNGRVNLSVAGNSTRTDTMAPARTDTGLLHGSASGVGPWEINPAYVLGNANGAQALNGQQKLASGSYFPLPNNNSNFASGRYGLQNPPPMLPALPGNTLPPQDRYLANTIPNRNVFNGDDVPPFYSRVNYNGSAGNRHTGSGSGGSPFPSYPAQYYSDTLTRDIQQGNHPAQFNPDTTGTMQAGNAGTYPWQDLLTLGTRQGWKENRFGTAAMAKAAPQNLLSQNFTYDNGGMPPTTTPFNPLNPTLGLNINPLRSTSEDYADLVRLLVTPQSSSLSRPEVRMFAINDNLSYDPNNPTNCAFGPIDLNRPLNDYRIDTTKALSPDNISFASRNAAQLSRQLLARDIFVRLVAIVDNLSPAVAPTRLVDGTDIVYVNDPTQIDYGYLRFRTAPGSTAKLPVLRSLAQLAANIVDFIDRDDINTTFTFWPATSPATTAPMSLIFKVAADPLNPMGPSQNTWLPNVGTAGPATIDAASLGNHVVFGTELPKVVLNEAFAELGNDRVDYLPTANPPVIPPMQGAIRPATTNFQKRIWVELHNTMKQDSALPDSGRARLYYPAGSYAAITNDTPVHQLVTMDMPTMVAGSVIDIDPTNVTGSPLHPSVAGNGAVVKTIVSQYNHDAIDAAQLPAISGSVLERSTIKPFAGAAAPSYQSNDNGFFVIGPTEDFPGQNAAQAAMMGNMPPAMGATLRVRDAMPALPVPNRMQYDAGTRDLGNPANALTAAAVYLQRTANPYLEPNDPYSNTTPFDPNKPINPFVTVDRLENIEMNNNVRYDVNGEVMPAPNLAMMASRGRQHPYASNSALQARQTSVVAGSPNSSFFKVNDVLQMPTLSWLMHLDRNLLNPLEIAAVNLGRQSELTNLFARGTNQTDYQRHSAEFLFLNQTYGGLRDTTSIAPLANLLQGPGMMGPQPTPARLAQVLDLFKIRSQVSGVPVGGREHGRININTAWHTSVARALFDGNDGSNQTSNAFDDVANMTNGVIASTNPNQAVATSFWGRMIGSGVADTNFRSPSFPNVGITDKPYRSLSSAQTPQDSVLRVVSDGSMPANFFGVFHNYNIPAASYQDPTHMNLVTEPLQKILNNTTTTSEQFLVIMTISFVEVRPQSPGISQVGGRVLLGRELYREVPGDLRTKFYAVVDRTSLGLDPFNNQLQADEKPWFTRLAADVLPGSNTIQVEAVQVPGVVDSNMPPNPIPHAIVDGVARPIIDPNANLISSPIRRFIRIGYGDRNTNQADGERVVTDSQFPQMAPNSQFANVVSWNGSVCTIQLPTNVTVTQYHAAGSPISNVLLGNPGPQPGFDVNSSRYRGVVPLFFLEPRINK
jgi:hypothetical protein